MGSDVKTILGTGGKRADSVIVSQTNIRVAIKIVAGIWTIGD